MVFEFVADLFGIAVGGGPDDLGEVHLGGAECQTEHPDGQGGHEERESGGTDGGQLAVLALHDGHEADAEECGEGEDGLDGIQCAGEEIEQFGSQRDGGSLEVRQVVEDRQ